MYRVLVAEDEQILAGNLKSYLDAQRYSVSLAYDGSAAVDQALAFRPHVMLLDFRLPDMDGFAVLDRLGDGWNGGRILMTGHPTNEVCAEAARRGIQHILFKPFPLAELGRLVCTVLGAAGPGAEPARVDRRRASGEAEFPMRLYDGTWLMADRRGHTRVDVRDADGEEARRG